MRRFLAIALGLTMVTQTPGAARAETVGSVSGTSLSGILVPLGRAIASSWLLAAVTGNGDRYAAMHAPAPTLPRARSTVSAAVLMAGEHSLRPQIREGKPESVVMPDRSALDPHHRRIDPLALRKSTPRQLKPASPTSSAMSSSSSGQLLVGSQRIMGAQPNAASHPPSGAAQPLGGKRGANVTQVLATSGTGIEHWWTYEERAIPGIGKAMVNVGTGNLLVAATDVDVHEQGIDLAFQRVYNLQSTHDYSGDDGGEPAIYGNRWTNNFDASLVYDSTANTITVYDLDGTACTYTTSVTAPGGWQPCTGEYATLIPTDGTDCTYAWTKPNGTVYWFHTDATGSGCGLPQAKHGRIQEILGRNQNNILTFVYSYDSSGNETSENITKVVVNHSDGDAITMQFGLVPGTSINELATITLPDTYATLQYAYDSVGNLVEVDKPGNNAAFPRPSRPDGSKPPSGDAPETYAYGSGGALREACGPRCTVSMWTNSPSQPTDGGAFLFSYDNSQLKSWQFEGVLNFTPSDGTSTPLFSSKSTKFVIWYTADFVYGSGSACTGTGAGTTTMCDSDGHSTIWTTNSANQVTQTQEFAGTAENQWIVTNQQWDSSNNLIWTKDANGNKSQYGYDNNTGLGYDCCGNMVEMQLPQAGDITNGPLAPLSYFSYDANFNVTAYCDPVYNQNHGNSWVNSPGGQDNLCPVGESKTTTLTYKYPAATQPFGCLSSIAKPSGYLTDISYPAGTGTGACGYGLPSKVQANQSITNYDGSTRRPTQSFAYDGTGNLTGYDKGQGDGGAYQDSWTLAYNRDNRLVRKTNNDSEITGAVITSTSCYYPDGSLFYTETPSQWAFDGNLSCPSMQTMLSGAQSPPEHATAYDYDLDGNQVKMTTYKGCSKLVACPGPKSITACATTKTAPIGTTCKYYDGLDRLVETAAPYDTRQSTHPYELYTFRWMNRYIYDLSQNGGGANLSISDNTRTYSGIVAYGNLFKTQEYLPQSSTMLALLDHGQYTSASWSDVRGTSFDGLDRAVAKYELAYNSPSPVTTNTYDCSEQAGLLCSVLNATTQTTSYVYDNLARAKEVSFSGPTQADGPRTYTYDANGRVASITAKAMGMMGYTYDVDGNKTSTTEPTNQGAASLICYAYYGDGLREYLGIGMLSDSCGTNTGGILQRSDPSNGGISQPKLFSYAYRNDGMLKNQQVNWLSNPSQTFAWTYTPGERELTQTDPLSGQSVPMPIGYGMSVTLGPKAYTYGIYGRVKNLTMPEGFTETSQVYDYDDELNSYTTSGGIQNQMTLNARGELLGDLAQASTYSANGTQLGNGNTHTGGAYNQKAPNGMMIDERSGMVMAISNPLWGKYSGALNGAGAYVYTYDAAGRQTVASRYPTWPSDWPGGGDAVQVYTQTFDTENHITQTGNAANLCVPSDSNCGSYGPDTAKWGPDGHERGATVKGFNTSVNLTAHWDGDALLFYAGSGTTTTELYIGEAGIMDASGGLFIPDRDQSGEQQTAHAHTIGAVHPYWFDSWNLGATRNVFIAKLNQQWSFNWTQIDGSCGFTYHPTKPDQQYLPCPFYPIFGMQRPDGYNMVGGNVQGARTYDPTSGQWLTPDPYAGNVHDPMSQKPYMWNGNNPIQYSDPSGYEWLLTAPNLSLANMLGRSMLAAIALASPGNLEIARQSLAAEKAADWATSTEGVNGKLQNIATDLFRGGEQQVSGGTAGAIRSELGGNGATGGSYHLYKGAVELRGLRQLLQGNSLSKGERTAAEAMYKDLRDAYGKYDPDEFIRNNNTPPTSVAPNKP